MAGSGDRQPAGKLARQAAALARSGRPDEAAGLYRECLNNDPEHMAALTFLSMHAMQHGDHLTARQLQQRAIRLDPDSAVLHQNLGLILQAAGRHEQALEAFDQSLRLKPEAAHVMLHRAGSLHALGRLKGAVGDCCRAGRINPAICRAHESADAPPVLRQIAQRAQQIVWDYEVGQERRATEPLRHKHTQAELRRVDEFLRVQHHRQPPDFPHPLQRPSVYFFPGLTPRPFYEPAQFPRLQALETSHEAMAAEFGRVLEESGDALVPYVPETGQPSAEGWDALAGSQDWSSFHLLKGGRRIEDNCRRCPHTMAVLEKLPLAHVQGHAPEAFFSILRPGAHIPPHFGVSNFKLTLHFPLIVPDGCAIRVGDETRPWRPGECMIFDDSFEHEAWNRSDHVRVVLITDIWQPELTEVERQAVQAVVKASDDFIRWCHGEQVAGAGGHA